MIRLLRALPWICGAAALLAAGMMAAAALYGVASLGLDLGSRLLFLALLPLSLQPWFAKTGTNGASPSL